MTMSDLPLVLLLLAFALPIVATLIALAAGMSVGDSLLLPLASLFLIVASTLAAAIVGDSAAAVFWADVVLLLLFAALSFMGWRTQSARETRVAEDVRELLRDAARRREREIGDDAPGRERQVLCVETVFLDTGEPEDFSPPVKSTGVLSAILPANAYTYVLFILFRVADDSLTVAAGASGEFRPAYSWFLASQVSFRRSAPSKAVGKVKCDRSETGCVIEAVGAEDIQEDVEYSSASVVNIVENKDPSKVTLSASGGTAFVAQKSVESVSLEIEGGAGGGPQAPPPAPTLKLTLKTTIKLPDVAVEKKQLTKEVIYKCVARDAA